MKTLKKVLVINIEDHMRDKVATERKATMDLASSADFQYILETGKKPQLFFKCEPASKYELYFFRSWTKDREKAGQLYHVLRACGYPCEADISCQNFLNKITQLLFVSATDVRIPKTLFVPREQIISSISFIEKHLEYPMIMKSVSASKGKANYRVFSRDELTAAFTSGPEHEYVFQECIPNSFDYRFVVIDHKTRLIYKRIRLNDDTHLNNVSAGSTTELVPLSANPDLNALAEHITQVLSRTICGVDLMTGHDGKTYFLEANPNPGLSSFDGMDILLDSIEKKAFDLK